jgi:hypothetical protein
MRGTATTTCWYYRRGSAVDYKADKSPHKMSKHCQDIYRGNGDEPERGKDWYVPLMDGSPMLNRLMSGLGTPVWRLMENLRLPNMFGIFASQSSVRKREESLFKQTDYSGEMRLGKEAKEKKKKKNWS